MRTPSLKTGYIVTALFLAVNVLLRINRIKIIQTGGVHTYNTFLTTANILCICSFLITMILVIVLENKKRKQNRKIEELEEQQRQEQLDRQRKDPNATLSISQPLRDSRIRDMLKETLTQYWTEDQETRRIVLHLIEQTKEMDSSQEKLQKLLKENGATKLYDTNDLLTQAEQYILRNIRKVLNCFQVYDPTNEEDVKKIQNLGQSVIQDNDRQLKNVREFLFAMTDFLNQQGDSTAEIQRLNIYKETILKSIEPEEKN